MLNRRIYLEMASASTLQVLINLSRSKPNRLLIDQCGCVQPTCKLLDMTMKREVFERAVMLLINCSTGPEMAPVHNNILEAGGVDRLVEMLKLAGREGDKDTTRFHPRHTFPSRLDASSRLDSRLFFQSHSEAHTACQRLSDCVVYTTRAVHTSCSEVVHNLFLTRERRYSPR